MASGVLFGRASIFLLLCFGLALSASATLAASTFSLTDSLAVPRHEHTATLLPDGTVLAAGGYGISGFLSSAEIYNPVSRTWTAAGSLAVPRYYHTATLLPDGTVLVAGGYNGAPLSRAEIYNPVAGTWAEAGNLSAPRYGHTATLLSDGKVLVAGGYGEGYLGSAEIYDPHTGTWVAAGTLSVRRSYHTATLLRDGKLLVAGGYNEYYNYYSYGYSSGGFLSGGSLSNAEIYDPVTRTWAAAGTFQAPRCYHTATLLPDGKVLIAGGWNTYFDQQQNYSYGSPVSIAVIYDPVTLTWTQMNGLGVPRYSHEATLLSDGKVLLSGGYGNNGNLSSAEIYNPVTSTWATTGSLTVSRHRHTATLLPSGKVLAAGGYGNSGNLSSAELYGPTYEVRAIPPLSGSYGNAVPSRMVAAGDNVEFSFGINTGYKLDAWLVNNVVVQYGGATFTLNNIQADAVVTATTYLPYRIPVISPVTIASNNLNPAWAKQGDTVALTFTTNFPNQTPTVTLLGMPASVEKLVGNNWIASVTVAPGTPEGPVTFSLSSISEVGTSSSPATVTTNASSVTVDGTAPVLALPGNIIAEASSAAGGVVVYTSGTTDTLDPIPSFNTAPASGSTFGLGTSVVTAFAQDAAGNTAVGSFTVTVQDRTAPVVASHADVTMEATSAAGAVVNYATATATDAVGVTSLAYSQISGTTFPIGSTTVTITAKDAAANTGTRTFIVTVTNSAPVVTLAGADPLTFEAAASYTDPGAAAVDAEDGSVTPAIINNTVVANVPGTYAVKWSVTDSAGAIGSATRVVNVVDTTAPAVAAHDNVTVEATSAAGGVVTYAAATATDAVGVTSLAYSQESGTTFPIGETTVSITAKDAATNEGTGTFTVKVQDTTAPVVASHADLTVEATSAAGAVVTYAAATATDAVGVTSLTYSRNSGTTFPIGETTVTITAKDAATNEGTGSFTVKVQDTTAPVVASHGNLTVEATGAAGAMVTYAAGTATDVVGVTDLTYSKASGTTFPLGLTTVTMTAKDAAGNTGTGSFTVTVADTTAPVVSAHADLTVEATSAAGAVVTYAAATATDAVGVTSLTYSQNSGTTFPLGTTTVTITAKDAAANTGTGTFTVTVQDTIPPVISSVTSAGLFAMGTSAAVSASFSDDVTVECITFHWDDGSANTVVNKPVSPLTATHSYTAAGVYSLMVTVTDGSGNLASQIFQYVVIYDPSAGFVTGGGWIHSAAGAYVPNPTLTGKANFGFTSKYKKGMTVPTGETEFQFQVGSLKFHSTSYEWLVVSGAKGQYKGSGTINGTGQYGFLLTATDGQIAGGGGTDKFRIKIWDKNAGDVVVYDNAAGSDGISGSPTQAIAGGCIVIHNK